MAMFLNMNVITENQNRIPAVEGKRRGPSRRNNDLAVPSWAWHGASVYWELREAVHL